MKVNAFEEALGELKGLLDSLHILEKDTYKAAELISESIKMGGKVLTCGNGGSAMDAQHFAAELVGRLKRERHPLPALALTADTAVLTALSNDYGYFDVFSRQVRAFGKKGDILVAISTSGRSENVNRAVSEAMRLGMKVIYLTGRKRDVKGDVVLAVPSENTQRIQEVHRFLLHMIAQIVEDSIKMNIS